METLYCHPELVSGSLDILIYIDSEIEDPVLKLVQDHSGPGSAPNASLRKQGMGVKMTFFGHLSFPQQILGS